MDFHGALQAYREIVARFVTLQGQHPRLKLTQVSERFALLRARRPRAIPYYDVEELQALANYAVREMETRRKGGRRPEQQWRVLQRRARVRLTFHRLPRGFQKHWSSVATIARLKSEFAREWKEEISEATILKDLQMVQPWGWGAAAAKPL
jgi:hypothetical protein